MHLHLFQQNNTYVQNMKNILVTLDDSEGQC